MLLGAQILGGDEDEPPQRVTGLWWCLRYSLMNGFVPPKIKQARVFVCRDAIGLKSSALWLRRKPT